MFCKKNGILNSISTNGHLIEHVPPNPFEMREKGISDFKLIGLNKVYTFKGFCSKHDTAVFKPIETEDKLDFNEPNQQALFCYRGISNEEIKKALSDLIVLRLEFWAMSKKLLETIDKKDIGKFKILEIQNVFNHSPKMGAELNLFKNI